MTQKSELTCWKCQSIMRLTRNLTHDNLVFICTKDGCVGRTRADENGQPVIADFKTRTARIEAHEVFDRIWKTKVMTRTQAYSWLCHVMGLESKAGHIALFDVDQCNSLQGKIQEEFPDLFLSRD